MAAHSSGMWPFKAPAKDEPLKGKCFKCCAFGHTKLQCTSKSTRFYSVSAAVAVGTIADVEGVEMGVEAVGTGAMVWEQWDSAQQMCWWTGAECKALLCFGSPHERRIAEYSW